MNHHAEEIKENAPDPHQDVYSKTIFGFWVFLLTDWMTFAVLFAAYVVLDNNIPPASELFNLPYTFIQTLLLLTASLTSGIGGAYAHKQSKKGTILFFIITLLLGIAFLWMQFDEFARLVHEGRSWKFNGFLSGFFTLVGTHWVHMIFAVSWVIVLLIPVFKEGIQPVSVKRLTCLRMFWQFLNIIWLFIFTIVYLMGVR